MQIKSSKIYQKDDNFFDRVERLREFYNLKQYVFADKTGISQSYYAEMKRGTTGPSFKFIKGLYQLSDNINPRWLFFGEGDMFLPAQSGNLAGDSGQNGAKTPLNELQTLFNELAACPPEQQEAVANVLKGLLQMLKK